MQEVEEMTSTSTNKILILMILSSLFVLTASSQEFYYNDGVSSFSSNDYFTVPEYESQEEIGTELVAPFIFVTILLHFALSRALNFILAEDIEEKNYHAIPYAIPLKDGHRRKHPDATRYSMVMSLAITGSLVPTPYWTIIKGVMASIGTLTAFVLLGLFVYGFYKVFQAIT